MKWRDSDCGIFKDELIHECGVYFFSDQRGVCFRKLGKIVYEPSFWIWILIKWKVERFLKDFKKRIKHEKDTKIDT